jgi:hypothetical protein
MMTTSTIGSGAPVPQQQFQQQFQQQQQPNPSMMMTTSTIASSSSSGMSSTTSTIGAGSGVMTYTDASLPHLSYPPHPYTVPPAPICPSAAVLPAHPSMMGKSPIPVGILVTPLIESIPTPVIHYGSSAGVIRCRRCRAYLNPYVALTDNGRRWTCNLCRFANDVPPEMYGQPLPNETSVEFLAPAEYMVRPPMPPCYLFLVHSQALSSPETASVLQAAVAALPGESRTMIALIVFDVHAHVLVFKAGASRMRLLTVVDAMEGTAAAAVNPADPSGSVMLPAPVSDILVPLRDAAYQDTIMDAVGSLAKLVKPVEEANVASALLMALRVMGGTGGKISLVLGRGSMVAPQKEAFYKEYALEANKLQVSVDVYSTAEPQMTMSPLLQIIPRITSGDWMPLRRMQETLVSSIALEAVMRIRASNNVKVSDFTGAFYLRSADLLALPCVKHGQTFGASLSIQATSNVPGGGSGGGITDLVYLQVALLYTSLGGERRIRVHNMALRTSAVLSDVIDSLDGYALSQLYVKQIATQVLDGGKPKIRDVIDQFTLTWRHGLQRLQPKHNVFLYINALSKMCLFGEEDVLENLHAVVESNELAMVPQLVRVDDDKEASVPLSRAYLDSEGVYLMIHRDEALVWAGSRSVVGSRTPEEEQVMQRVRSICERVNVPFRGEASVVVEGKQGVQHQVIGNRFYKRLVEDRQVTVQGSMSYLEFVNHVFSGK